MKNATIQQYPYSVVVTDSNPVDVLDSPSESTAFRFPFGEGETYSTREDATAAAEWFVQVAAPIL